MSRGKMSDSVSIPLFGFTLVVKPRNSDFESHSNSSTYSDKKRYASDLSMSHRKMSDFVSFPLFRFTLGFKLRNFNFNGH